MKTALVCIAKDEDNYIGEWVDYHLKLGFTDVFVVQNQWRANLEELKKRFDLDWDAHVHFSTCDDYRIQMSSYNRFIDDFYSKYDFGCFFDVDEYLSLGNGVGLDDFLSDYADCRAIGINWRLFGDSGIECVRDGDYSVVKRFIRCGRNVNRHVKICVNFTSSGKDLRFTNWPHVVFSKSKPNDKEVVVSVGKKNYITTPFNETDELPPVQLNHYYCKTKEEFQNCRMKRGDCQFTKQLAMTKRPYRFPEDFDKYNQNDVIDTTARDFYVRNSNRN